VDILLGKQVLIKRENDVMFNSRLIQYWFFDGGFWIRVFGRGFSVVNKIKHPPLFSERYGYRQVFRFGNRGIEWLKNERKIK